VMPTSCEKGKSCVEQASCCEPVWIEGGGPYERDWGNPFNDPTTKRSVGGFYLDRFEVTVSRFFEFVDDYESSGIPEPGAGSHPGIANSGWQAAWEQEPDPYNPVDPNKPDGPKNTAVPKDQQDLVAQLERFDDCTWHTSSNPPTSNRATSNLAIGCVNWFVAFAFCAWDHGRLPTEAEWNYAAAHGADRLHYPWSVDSNDRTYGPEKAWYHTDQVQAVGTKDAGHARFARYGGLEDLSGNVQEWTLDRFLPVTSLDPYHDVPCVDCFERWNEANDTRVARGGAFYDLPPALLTGVRSEIEPVGVDSGLGFRCAYDLKKE
jgi:formylglycine-generating enzyme